MKHSSCYRTRYGLTLIEVLGGLFLLSVLLVSMLTAHGRQVRQIRRAEVIHEAIQLSEQFLASHFSNLVDNPFPLNGLGFLEGERRLQWRTRVTDTSRHTEFGVDVVRFEVFEHGVDLDKKLDEPLLAVDLLIVDPNWTIPSEREQAANATTGSRFAVVDSPLGRLASQ